MSALRINVPGKPIEFIELGPARARMAGGSILGWAIEPVRRVQPPPPGKPYTAGPRPYTGDRCAKIMPRTGEPCGRRPDHRDGCRSRSWVEADTERRRVTK